MSAVKEKAVVYPAPFQHLPPLRSWPPSEVTWNQVMRVQGVARQALRDVPLEQIIEIAHALLQSMESFYNECEYLRWMSHPVPEGATYYGMLAYEDTPKPEDSPYSDIEIINGYCIDKMGLDYLPAQIFAVWSLIKLDEMAGYYNRFHQDPKRVVDLEMAGGSLCEAMEAIAAAYSVERFRRMNLAIAETEALAKAKFKKEVAKHAAAGKAEKNKQLKAVLFKKYAAGRYASPNAASIIFWEDILKNPQHYPPFRLTKTRGRITIYDWLREEFPEDCVKLKKQPTIA